MHVSLSRVLTVVIMAFSTVAAGGLFMPASAAYQQSPDSTWVPNGTVYAMARVGNTIYLGGDFTNLKDPVTGLYVARARLAAVDATTGAPLAWNPGADATVRALAVGPDGTVFAGGIFTTAAQVTATRLAAITPAGKAVTGWSAAASGTVRDIVADSSGLYAAGSFGSINGVARARVAKLSLTTGAMDRSFNARVAGGSVYALARSGDTMLLGGSFTTLSGATRQASGSVSLTSGAVTTWAPARQCDTCWVLDLATDGTKVYEAVAGPGGRVVAFSLSTAARSWVRSGDGDVQAVAVEAGVVYVAGHFSAFNGLPRRQLVTYSASGVLSDYSIAFTGKDYPGIWSVIADTSALRIGGAFSLANNTASRYATFRLI